MRPMSWLRYYADVCCPEDREYYRIVNDGEQLHDSAPLRPSPLSHAASSSCRTTPLSSSRAKTKGSEPEIQHQ